MEESMSNLCFYTGQVTAHIITVMKRAFISHVGYSPIILVHDLQEEVKAVGVP
jgi:hypothetical protein